MELYPAIAYWPTGTSSQVSCVRCATFNVKLLRFMLFFQYTRVIVEYLGLTDLVDEMSTIDKSVLAVLEALLRLPDRLAPRQTEVGI